MYFCSAMVVFVVSTQSCVLENNIKNYPPQLRLFENPYLYLTIAFLVSTFAGLVIENGRPFSILRTLNYYFYFLLGYFVRNRQITALTGMKFSVILLTSVIIIVLFFYPNGSEDMLRCADHFGIKQIPNKLLLQFCSLTSTICIYNLFTKGIDWLSEIGRYSMFFYIYHSLIIKFLLPGVFDKNDVPTGFLSMILLSLLVTAFLALIRRNRLMNKLIK